MARQLWLLRHADAEPHGSRPDAERRLTARGERQARLAGVALGRAQVTLDAVLVSPKVRARQTAELAAEEWSDALGGAPSGEHPPGSGRAGKQASGQEGEQQQAILRTHAPLAGGFDAAQALDALATIPADGRLMVVGHEPDLSTVVEELTGARVDLKKGGLAVVRLEGGVPHRGAHPDGRRQAAGRRPTSRAPLYSRSEGAGGELVILLRPRELALIGNLATADV
jgi:phosphohistidine phosphatase